MEVLYERPVREYGGFQVEFQAPSDLAAKVYERGRITDYVQKNDLSLWIIRKDQLTNTNECRYVVDLIPSGQIVDFGVPEDQPT